MSRMTMIGTMIDMELSESWDIPRHYIVRAAKTDLIGKAVDSIEELISVLPSDEKYNKNIRLGGTVEGKNGYKGYNVYISTFRNHEYRVAYGCNECNKIVIGPPNITEIGHGVLGMIYSCCNCKKRMNEIILGHTDCFGDHDDDF